MLRRLLFTLGKLLFLFILPFFLLIRGSVFLHENYAPPASVSLLGGVLMSAVLLFFYMAYLQGRLTGRAGNVRRTYGLAFALVAVYCLPGLFYLSASNAKHESVRKEFTRLHPVLRLGVSTITFLDKKLIVTDAARQPEDYGKMGLPAKSHSLHYRQSSGYAHAVDLRTIRQGELRNTLVAVYFRLMGFNTLRHVGTADHLHVSLMSHGRPGGI
ncbi:MAG: hypothetical protein H6573_06580 [Lewinellaceae bacterium]|nr:hypothetical protein [Phaeodactylibacter sp.]MCB0612695.1 hypothetical protein [Phaeodactylibacter sp.]MCB9347169.1 hypothetical protein [Lewinellaceae bacterium]